MKYPIGIQSFEQIIEDGYVYLDKTALVYDLVTNGKIYFLSRPRRFGKSLLVSTLKCYFEGKKELFKGLSIDKLEKEWKQYPVFHLDFNGNNFTNPGELEVILENFVASQEMIYGKSPFRDSLGGRFEYVLKAAHEKTGLRAVVLIDEYDKPILDVLDTQIKTSIKGEERLLEDWNREVLKGFYSVFKAADANLQFVLLTGVTKFSQVSVFSGFNQPNDISMDEHYEALCGSLNRQAGHGRKCGMCGERHNHHYQLRRHARHRLDDSTADSPNSGCADEGPRSRDLHFRPPAGAAQLCGKSRGMRGDGHSLQGERRDLEGQPYLSGIGHSLVERWRKDHRRGQPADQSRREYYGVRRQHHNHATGCAVASPYRCRPDRCCHQHGLPSQGRHGGRPHS